MHVQLHCATILFSILVGIYFTCRIILSTHRISNLVRMSGGGHRPHAANFVITKREKESERRYNVAGNRSKSDDSTTGNYDERTPVIAV